MRTSVAALVTVLVVLAGGVVPASALAHSSLDRTVPAIDSTVASSPEALVLTFSNPVRAQDGLVSVLDLAGREHVQKGVRAEGKTLTIPVDAKGTGTRVVAWQAISDHGSPISGSFVYHVGRVTPGADAGAAAVAGDPVRRELTEMFRAVTLASLLLGAALLVVAAARATSRSGWLALARGAMVVGIVAAIVGLLSHGDFNSMGTWLAAAACVLAVALGASFPWARRPSVLAACGAALVIGLAGLAVASPPEPPTTRFEQQVQFGEDRDALVTLDPSVAGRSDIEVAVRDTRGEPDAKVQTANVRYHPTDESLGYFTATLERDSAGSFSAEDLVVPFPGEWEFQVQVTEDAFSSSLATFTTDVHANPELER